MEKQNGKAPVQRDYPLPPQLRRKTALLEQLGEGFGRNHYGRKKRLFSLFFGPIRPPGYGGASGPRGAAQYCLDPLSGGPKKGPFGGPVRERVILSQFLKKSHK